MTKINLYIYGGTSWTHDILLDNKIFNRIELHTLGMVNNKIKRYTIKCDPVKRQNGLWVTNFLDYPAIDFSNISDTKQIMLANNFGITIPYTNMTCSYESLGLFGNVDIAKKYILKSHFSARGLGKYIGYIDTILNMARDVRNTDIDKVEFNTKYCISNMHVALGKQLEDEKYSVYTGLKEHTMYIQEYIPDVVAEYRMLYFKGMDKYQTIIEHRTGYQPGTKTKREHTIIDNRRTKEVPIEIISRLIEFGDSLDYPTLSFDIYIRENGSWGIFEFSNEYGIDYPLPILKKLRNMFTKAMVNYTLPAYEKKYKNILE